MFGAMNNQVASPPSMSSSSFVTAAVRVKKEVDEDEVEPPTVVSSSLSAAAIPATSMRMGLKKEEDDISNGNAETGDGNYDGGPRHGSVRCTVKKEEKDDDDGHQNNTQNPTTIRSTTMVPDAAISSSSSNSNTGSHSGGTENDNRANSDDADDEYNDDANDHHHVKKWEAGNWCWLDDYTSNDMKHQKKEEEEEEEERKEEKLNNGTNGDDDTGVKTEENGHYDNNFDTNTSRNAGDDDTGVKKEEEEDNDNSFGNTNNSRNGKKEKDDDDRGFDTTNENKNRNTCTRTDTTVSDTTIKDNDDYYDDWTTGNWCLEGRPHSTTTIGGRSAVGSAAATSVTVSTSTRNKRKLKQSRENHKKKPRTINQNNKHKKINNTNLDEDNNNIDGLHDDGKDDDDDDDDDDYSDVDCDDSNDDESEPDSVVVAETSMNNGGAIVRNKFEERWNEMYGRFQKYKTKYQSMSIPRKFDDDPHLGPWVGLQRQMYKNKSLSAERIDRLTSIGFIWDPIDAQWNEMYARLVAYKKQYKSTCVPRSYEADPTLARWVRNQRKNYNKVTEDRYIRLTEDRIHLLNSIGFVWKLLDVRWTEMYELLVAYKKQYNSTCVPRPYDADPKLASWVNTQRQNYSKLTADRKYQLNSIGFVWKPLDARWTEMYDRLVVYKNQYKSTCVPFSYNPQLATWVQKQRVYYHNGTNLGFTAYRIHQLNSIGFIWNADGNNQYGSK